MNISILILLIGIAIFIGAFIVVTLTDKTSETLTQQEKDDMSYTAEYMKGLRK
jgi:uncharacterized Tic20 family protein